MHLAGEAYARDRIGGDTAVDEHRADRLLTRSPPVVGILLGPGRLRRREWHVVRRRRRQHSPVLMKEQRARPAGADVDA